MNALVQEERILGQTAIARNAASERAETIARLVGQRPSLQDNVELKGRPFFFQSVEMRGRDWWRGRGSLASSSSFGVRLNECEQTTLTHYELSDPRHGGSGSQTGWEGTWSTRCSTTCLRALRAVAMLVAHLRLPDDIALEILGHVDWRPQVVLQLTRSWARERRLGHWSSRPLVGPSLVVPATGTGRPVTNRPVHESAGAGGRLLLQHSVGEGGQQRLVVLSSEGGPGGWRDGWESAPPPGTELQLVQMRERELPTGS